ncbi:MAG: 4Fe-4S binding protein [Lachnospiraceae bacterium]|nr:4Fe-4S binding protein [Lachnospiraceae bacterium]
MDSYEHSVLLDRQKCTGCTTCLHHCPTEAIRIRDGHAVINHDRCIDCGECIRICPHNAKRAVTDKLEDMKRFSYKIALPAPSLYGQFNNMDDVDYILNGLLKIGFDDVFEVAIGAELVSAYTREYMKADRVPVPLISSACPAILRLISLMYPSLEEHVLHILPPMEVAADLARKKAKEEHPELKDEEIGVCFISPCPSKASYVRNNFGEYSSKVDVVVAISDIYFRLLDVMKRDEKIEPISETGMNGIMWAKSGGESTAIMNEDYLAADGIDNVRRVLEEIENGNIQHVKFVELNACPGGCVGGVLTVQNPFIARARLRSISRILPIAANFPPKDERYIPDSVLFDDMPSYVPVSRLSSNIGESMRMMSDIQRLRSQLPGIDCGACGAPNCRAHAEDIVRAGGSEITCPILDARKGAQS